MTFYGITRWHELGYKGQGIKIASKEDVMEGIFDDVLCTDPFTIMCDDADHGTSAMDLIRQVVPNATKIATRFSEFDELIKNPPDILTSSTYPSNGSVDKYMPKCIELLNKGCFLVSGAGNSGTKGVLYMVKNDVFKSVGACRMVRGEIVKATFSSEGEELDYMSFDRLNVTWKKGKTSGTSFASPVFAGMIALVQCFFMLKTGKKLTHEQLDRFIRDNCIDLDKEGRDVKTGYGLFILPNPTTIDVSKYCEDYRGSEEENMVRYNTLDEIPEWGKETVSKLINKGALKGDENGLNMSEDLLRTLVIHDRMGLYN